MSSVIRQASSRVFTALQRNFFPASRDENITVGSFVDSSLDPMETGEELISLIYENIAVYRPIVVVGPRGSGKSYCAQQAINRAVNEGLVRGKLILQGNRELSRDYLSEDQLVIERTTSGNGSKKGGVNAPELDLIPALGLCQVGEKNDPPNSYLAYLRDRYGEDTKEFTKYKNMWPAIPQQDPNLDPFRFWRRQTPDKGSAGDFVVLFMDEITRFGDGLLDSLFSIMEERVLIRRGEPYFVPLCIVATANPPGYDPTCKKLSPPLASRFARIVRVAQPSLPTIVKPILNSRVADFLEMENTSVPRYGKTGEETDEFRNQLRSFLFGLKGKHHELLNLIAGVTLALWGDPHSKIPGLAFLNTPTIQLLSRVMNEDRILAKAMTGLSGLVSFGPDVRAAQDWLILGLQKEFRSMKEDDAAACVKDVILSEETLKRIAVNILAGKVRETYNEGMEPQKSHERDQYVQTIVDRIFQNPSVRRVFAPPQAEMVACIAFGTDDETMITDYVGYCDHMDFLNVELNKVDTVNPLRRIPWIVCLAQFPLDRGREGDKHLDEKLRSWFELCVQENVLLRHGKQWRFYSEIEAEMFFTGMMKNRHYRAVPYANELDSCLRKHLVDKQSTGGQSWCANTQWKEIYSREKSLYSLDNILADPNCDWYPPRQGIVHWNTQKSLAEFLVQRMTHSSPNLTLKQGAISDTTWSCVLKLSEHCDSLRLKNADMTAKSRYLSVLSFIDALLKAFDENNDVSLGEFLAHLFRGENGARKSDYREQIDRLRKIHVFESAKILAHILHSDHDYPIYHCEYLLLLSFHAQTKSHPHFGRPLDQMMEAADIIINTVPRDGNPTKDAVHHLQALLEAQRNTILNDLSARIGAMPLNPQGTFQ